MNAKRLLVLLVLLAALVVCGMVAYCMSREPLFMPRQPVTNSLARQDG